MTEPVHVTPILHLTLPPGLPEADAETLWRECFQPLLGAIHHTPTVRLGVVLAGELVEDFQQRHPEGIDWLRALIEREQIELVGTALHEPILAAIPERDAVGQFLAHATLLKKVFGAQPKGAWLPHGVWDPVIPKILARADLGWVAIDDRLLSRGDEPDGVWRTEREGHAVALLPLDVRARDVAGEVQPRQLVAHFERRAQRGHRLLGLGLSANRFATRRDQAWLATLLSQLGRTGTIATLRPSDAVRTGPQRGRVYITHATDAAWATSLLRYEEANRLHKRATRASRLIERLERMVKEGGIGGHRPDPSQLVQAHRYLYRAQAAEVYGHGPHAGIYDARLRAAAWRDLLRAERVAAEAMRTDDRLAVETTDIDCDGNDDVVLRTPTSTVVIDRAHSAGVIEFSIASRARNLVDTMTRSPEAYHVDLLKGVPADDTDETTDTVHVHGSLARAAMQAAAAHRPVGDEETTASVPSVQLDASRSRELVRSLVHDPRPRVCFVEHLIGSEVTVEHLQHSRYAELGKGLRDAPWQLVSAERHGEDALRAILFQDGHIEDLGGEKQVRMQKRYTLHREPMLDVRLDVVNRGHEVLRARLALELDLAPAAGGESLYLAHAGERRPLTRAGDAGEVQDVRVEASDLTVHVVLRKAARLWHYPIETVHRSGAELVLGQQGTCLVLVWPIELWGQEKARFDVRVAVETG